MKLATETNDKTVSIRSNVNDNKNELGERFFDQNVDENIERKQTERKGTTNLCLKIEKRKIKMDVIETSHSHRNSMVYY